MSLPAGTRFGPYEIQSLLGAGGMGEVYRATDTKLKRQVAIKILPASLSGDRDRLARLHREAEVLASLSHPHIAAIYGLEDAGETTALVMELVEGRTLADVIGRSGHGIGVSDALPIARQIADALSAAHAQGVVHRDLKPANIKVTSDGAIKVLDFGLAKAFDTDPLSSSTSHSPTLTSPAMTRLGVIIGTAAYMSPEQARGKPADKRADVWAFGVVLFEMLTGRRLFGGSEVSDTLAFVLTQEPDWSLLPRDTPAAIRTLLRRCLQKDRAKRLADLADARLEIDEVLSAPLTTPEAAPVSQRETSAWRRALPWAVTTLALVAAAAVVAIRPAPEAPSTGSTVRLNAHPGAPVVMTPGQGSSVALSPDGSTLAFTARLTTSGPLNSGRLYVRRLGEFDARALPGTEGAASPFFSPDGRWLAFFAGNALKKVSTDGGAVVELCAAPAQRGGWWGEDDTIFFASPTLGGLSGGVIMRVPAAGGEPVAVTTAAAGEYGHTWPQLLPGGRGILYTVPGSFSDFDTATIKVQPLPAGEPREVHRGGTFARYLANGQLTYVRGGTLFSAPFDLDSLALTGPPSPVLDGVYVLPSGGGAGISVSATGTLVYVPAAATTNFGRAPVLWLDRTSAVKPLRAEPSAWATPRFSPEGNRLAMTIYDGQQHDIWVYDWPRDIMTRLTSDPADDVEPVWSPDGTSVAFGSRRNGIMNLYWQRADGTGNAQRLTESVEPQLPDSWHPDGRALMFHEGSPLSGQQRLMILPLERDTNSGWKSGTPSEFVGGRFIKAFARFSPDGRWVAYTSIESGAEVFVLPFPGPGTRTQISSAGGTRPMWSPIRPELFFTTASTPYQIMVAPYSAAGEVFTAGRAAVWSETPFSSPPVATWGAGVDLHPDGERFAVPPAAAPDSSTPESQLVFVFNFFDELRRRGSR